MATTQDISSNTMMTKLEAWLMKRNSPTYNAYYNGKMSYALHGEAWRSYVEAAFPNLQSSQTSENVYKTVIDLYAENLVPVPDELEGFSNVLPPLLSRGECPVVVDSAGTPHFPEHYEVMSDGRYTVACIFTRSIELMEDYVTFADSKGTTRLFKKPVPDDMSAATMEGYQFVETKTGNTLLRLALDDKGFGATLAAWQDRVNHSIIDQTIVAEMYARPFWYLMNVQLPPKNPYLAKGAQPSEEAMQEHENNMGGRIFTTSSDGPFGQLEPPTIQDMIAYHDSIVDKGPQTFGIPAHYFKPGDGVPPTGVALKVLSKRFNNKINRMREDLEPVLEELAALLNIPKTGTKQVDGKEEKVWEFWAKDDDLLQESLDAHGLALSQMGYPLGYIAEVVTPGVDLDDYEEEGAEELLGTDPGAVDMTAMGQPGLPATPGQVASYASNPGQRAIGK